MALTKRKISNLGDALTAQDGTALAGIEVTFLLVNSDNSPTDAWDVITGERVAPIKETATTDVNGIFKVGATDGVDLWPNDRGSTNTFYRCTVKSPNVRQFMAALPSGDLSTLQWIDFSGNTSPISSETYPTPLRIVEGDTVPTTGVLTTTDGGVLDITGYTIKYEVTDSLGVTVDYPCVLTTPLTGAYSCDLSAITVGRYTARLEIINDAAQTQHTAKFLIEVTA